MSRERFTLPQILQRRLRNASENCEDSLKIVMCIMSRLLDLAVMKIALSQSVFELKSRFAKSQIFWATLAPSHQRNSLKVPNATQISRWMHGATLTSWECMRA